MSSTQPISAELPGILLGDVRCIPEMIAHTLTEFVTQQLGQAQFVCSQWLTVCQGMPDLRRRINYAWALNEIRKIEDPTHRFYGLLTMAKAKITTHPEDARALIEEAKGIMLPSKVFNKSFHVFALVKVEVLLDHQQARRTALSIDDDRLKRDQALALVIAAEAPTHPLQAEEDLLHVLDPYYFKQAFPPVVKAKAKYSLSEAREFALANNAPQIQITGLLEIAKIELLTNPQAAAFTLKDVKAIVQTISDLDERSHALRPVVELEAELNCEDAKQTLLLMTIRDARDCGRLAIARVEARTNHQKARETLLTIEYEGLRVVGLLGINWDVCRQEAKALALSIKDPTVCDLSLKDVVKSEIPIDLTLAHATALLIKDPRIQSEALLEILKTEVLINIPAARLTLLSIQHDTSHQLGLFEIVKVEALIDVAAARETTLSIANSAIQPRAMAEVVKAEAAIDLSAAKTRAVTLPFYENYFAETLFTISNM